VTSICPLCADDGGHVIARTSKFRVIRAQGVNETGFPAFYRLIWRAHVREFTDLVEADQWLCMQALVCVEKTLRQHLQPDKINLASLGNQVPHLHWHVIARFAWDSHFPAPAWATEQRPVSPEGYAQVLRQRQALETDLAKQIGLLPSENHPAL